MKSISDNEQVSATVTHGPNPVYSDAKSAMLNSKAVLAAVQAKAKAIRIDLENSENKIASFNDAELKLAKLDRDIEMARNVVKTNVELLEQARIDNELGTKEDFKFERHAATHICGNALQSQTQVSIGRRLPALSDRGFRCRIVF